MSNVTQSEKLYSKFNEYIEKKYIKTIVTETLKLLEEENIIVLDKIAIARARKEKGVGGHPGLIAIELYLVSGWKVTVLVNSEDKILVGITYGNGGNKNE